MRSVGSARRGGGGGDGTARRCPGPPSPTATEGGGAGAVVAARSGRGVAALERRFLARRAGPPDVPGAVREAFRLAVGPADAGATAALRAAALAVAAAVERHGAGFPPGGEPAYHDRHHQAEAVIAMGLLCRTARRLGMLGSAEEAAIGILAMAGHDLLHDGSTGGAPDRLERRSADATVRIAAAAAGGEGPAPGQLARVRRVILATEASPGAARAALADPLARLAREADLCASLMPELGWRLSAALSEEWRRAGAPGAALPATYAGHLRLLRGVAEESAAAVALGMAASRRAQIAGFAEVARRLGVAEATPEAGAAALDGMEPATARAVYLAALRESEGGGARSGARA